MNAKFQDGYKNLLSNMKCHSARVFQSILFTKSTIEAITMTAAEKLAFSATDFLDWEARQETKHEFVDGEFFAMAGAGETHVTISGTVFATLRTHLRGTPCRAYITDMKVRVEKVDAFFYPDVFVTCSAQDATRKNFKTEPKLVIEVLSPSTAAYDRGLKFAYYRELTSLEEYVLIDPERVSVEVFRRDEAGRWVLYPFGHNDTVELACINQSLSMSVIYEDAWPEPQTLHLRGLDYLPGE
jgi:Uma2 family endonuclease